MTIYYLNKNFNLKRALIFVFNLYEIVNICKYVDVQGYNNNYDEESWEKTVVFYQSFRSMIIFNDSYYHADPMSVS